MAQDDVVIAVFEDHPTVDTAVRKLMEDGFEMKHFSVVGKGYHTEEKVVGFYSAGDRMKVWGRYGAFWGGIWGLLFGGVFLTLPVIGPIVVLGHLALIVVSAVEGAIAVGGLSALGAALFSIGIPKDKVISYETALKANGFIVMGHGTADEMSRAKKLLESLRPKTLDLHTELERPGIVDAATVAAS
ncbi:MAG: DUF1269 domain-containing protein [Burkholderiaceae bacterium]|jgi:hypothetical protein